MSKRIVTLFMITIMILSTVISPLNTQANSLNGNSIELTLGDSTVLITEKDMIDNMRIFEVQGEYTSDVVTVNIEDGDFIIENEDGVIEKYNIKDFEVPLDPTQDKQQSQPILDGTGKNVLPSLNEMPGRNLISTQASADPTRQYLGDINLALGFDTTATWNRESSYYHEGLYVDVYRGTYTKYTKTATKYSFSVGTTLSVILGVVVAFVGGGFTLAGLNAVLSTLGVTVVAEAIAYTIFNPTMSVKQVQVGRGFFVRPKGYTIKTKYWTNYLEVASNGKIHLQKYSDDKYASWYNDYSNQNVSEVAYQQYRYIEGFRSSAPYGSEFSWR